MRLGKKNWNHFSHRRKDILFRGGDEYTPICDCKYTSPGVIHFPATFSTFTSPPPLAFAMANRLGGNFRGELL